MKMKALSISVAILSLAASAALAAGLTERLQTSRMTVTKVDGDRFFCAEHQRWTQFSKQGAHALGVGDIVSVDDARPGQPVKVRVVRTAADELSSGE
jgi:ABC-type sugar transport system substrate-binding protein